MNAASSPGAARPSSGRPFLWLILGMLAAGVACVVLLLPAWQETQDARLKEEQRLVSLRDELAALNARNAGLEQEIARLRDLIASGPCDKK